MNCEGGGVMNKDKKRYIKSLCREIAKIDREHERLAKEKLELQLEIARIAGKYQNPELLMKEEVE